LVFNCWLALSLWRTQWSLGLTIPWVAVWVAQNRWTLWTTN